MQFAKRLIVFMLLMCPVVVAKAQEDAFKFDRYGVQEGLSQGTVWDILQDSKGFWWFATSDGLNRFDGYEFHTYHHHEEEGASSLTSGDIRKLYLDRNGDIWCFFVNGGCSRYNHITDNFTSAKGDYFDIHTFSETADGKLWCYNAWGNVECLDRNTATTTKRFKCPADSTELNDKMNFVAFRNNLLVITEKHLYTFHSAIETWSKNPAPQGLTGINCSIIVNGKFYVGTNTGKLLICTENLSVEASYKIADAPIVRIAPWTEGFLLATAKGLVAFNPATGKKTLLQHDPNNQRSLSTNDILSLATDTYGNLWVGTNSGGVNKLMPKINKFSLIPSENYYYIKAIYKKRGEQYLYCSVFRKGIEIYDLKNLKKPCVTIPLKQNIFKIEQWDQENLLLFDRQAMFLLNTRTLQVSNFGEEVLNRNGIRNMSAVSRLDNNDFLVGAEKKLYLFQRSGSIRMPFSLQLNDEIICVERGGDQTYYVGTTKGLFTITPSGQTYALIPSVYCKHILKTGDNTFWIATTTGLYEYKPGQQVKLYNKEKYGLANDFIYGVLQGAGKTLWLSHNRGISRLNISKSIFKNFTLNNNLQSYEFNTGAFFRSEDSIIVFGGVRGINYFNEHNFFDDPVAPIPIISNIRVNDIDYRTDTVIWHKKYLSFPYEQNTLSFEFTGLQFSASKNVQYFYKLEGVDKDWIYANGQRFARYPKIPPGDYALKVRAFNDDGKESQQIATLHIHIVTPMYMQWWFKLLSALLFMTLVASLVYFWQLRKSRKQEEAFQLLNQLKNERERISRDLHDNVGAQITYLITSMDWATKQLSPYENHLKERLLNLKSSAQNMMSSIRDTIWALNKEEITVQDFADRLKQYILYQIRDNSALDLNFQEHINSDCKLFSNTVLSLFRIGQEAVQNILKHAGAEKIMVQIECNDKHELKILIADDGIGFDPEIDYSDHFGLDNMKFRAKEIEATLEISSTEGKGTRIVISKQLES